MKKISLMFLVLLLSGAESFAQSQGTDVDTNDEVWSGTLTVGKGSRADSDDNSSDMSLGYFEVKEILGSGAVTMPHVGALTNDTFRDSGDTHTVLVIEVDLNTNHLRVVTSPPYEPEDTSNYDWHFYIGNDRFNWLRSEGLNGRIQWPFKAAEGQPDDPVQYTQLELESIEEGDQIKVGITSKRRDGALKLDEASGRLDIFDDADHDGVGTWRGICDDGWDSHEADVACYQLNGQYVDAVPKVSLLPGSANPVTTFLLDDLQCTGNEIRVIDCGNAGRNVHNCSAFEYAGVCCGTNCSAN